MTADDLLRTHLPDKHVELVRGVLVVSEPTGFRHGTVSATLTKLLAQHVDAHHLGRVLAAGTGFKLAADPIPYGRRMSPSCVGSGLIPRRRGISRWPQISW
jgi:hypothetical protein